MRSRLCIAVILAAGVGPGIAWSQPGRTMAANKGAVHVTCQEDGATLSVDGFVIGTCPLANRVELIAGEHYLALSKPGFQSSAQRFDVTAGETRMLVIDAIPQIYRVEQRFPTWLPWTTLGSGVALGAIGGLLLSSASSDYDDYDSAISSACGSMGCRPEDIPQDVRDLEDRAKTKNTLGVASLVVGGGAFITALVMIALDEKRVVTSAPPADPAVQATVTDDSVGLSWTTSF